jgi:transposase
MDDKALYQQILGIYSPWRVEAVNIDPIGGSVVISVGYDPELPVRCPECGTSCTTHDHGPIRQWRHLDTCQYKTVIEASLPRSNCPSHGVRTVSVPWAEKGSRYTAMFEAFILMMLKQTSIKKVQHNFRISWDSIDGIMQRGVERGLARRKLTPIHHIGIDEKAFQKHHRYSTILINKDNNTVLEVLDDRKKETLLAYLLAEKDLFSSIKSISMDMWDAYISAFIEFNPALREAICFDHFHVSAYFAKGVDKVRAEEHRELQEKKTTH